MEECRGRYQEGESGGPVEKERLGRREINGDGKIGEKKMDPSTPVKKNFLPLGWGGWGGGGGGGVWGGGGGFLEGGAIFRHENHLNPEVMTGKDRPACSLTKNRSD